MTRPLKPNPKLMALWQSMTPPQRKRFAALARSTSGSLRQTVEGRRGISSDLAIRLEKAAARLGMKPISRTDLSDTCSKCEFARACLKAKLS